MGANSSHDGSDLHPPPKASPQIDSSALDGAVKDRDGGAVATLESSCDLISSLPDEILHRILSFIPTYKAIRTSVLSKRWRHLWCETPSLDFSYFRPITAASLNKTLSHYKASNIISLNLPTSYKDTAPQIDTLIKFAINRNVQKIFIVIKSRKTYIFPDSFFLNSSVKQISLDFSLNYSSLFTRSNVVWSSLTTLSLSRCEISNETIAKILSGCPVLESLTLRYCAFLERLDLSKSPTLTRLEIDRNVWADLCTSSNTLIFEVDPNFWIGPKVIVAPHIRYLRLTNRDRSCGLVDVSSLTEANFDIRIHISRRVKDRFLQTMVINTLTRFENVERLTLGETVLQILSLAELRGARFPVLKVETLIVEAMIAQSIIPGIARLLQNSPGLKKLTVHVTDQDKIMNENFGNYLELKGSYLNTDQGWKKKCEVFPNAWDKHSTMACKDATSKLLASFIELVEKNTKTLETVVVSLKGDGFDDAKWFEEQLQMVRTPLRNFSVSIVLKGRN